jgi:GH24 family phage-related lysozyme (muramidase)
MTTLSRYLQENPPSFAALEGIVDDGELQREYNRTVRGNLQVGGFVSPTEGITVEPDEPDGITGFFSSLYSRIFNTSGAEAFDTEQSRYRDNRFNFYTAESGFSRNAVNDETGNRMIGYGFNLSDLENQQLAMDALDIDEQGIQALISGETELTERSARVLYEAHAAQAEALVRERLGDVALPANQRMVLTSLAMQHPDLIGPNLVAAIQSGRLSDAEAEIRERSNGRRLERVANRRSREADMFANFQELGASDDQESSAFSLLDTLGFGRADREEASAQEAAQGEAQSIGDLEWGSLVFEESPAADEGIALTRADGERVGTLNGILGMVPSHVRTMLVDVINTQLGVDQSGTVRSAEWFSQDEQTAILQLVQTAMQDGQREGYVDYDTYGSGIEGLRPQDESLMMADNQDVIRNTLGAFNWHINEDNELIVTDQYDWNDAAQLQAQYPTTVGRVQHLMGFVAEWTRSRAGNARASAAGRINEMFGTELDTNRPEAPSRGLKGIVRRAMALFGSVEGQGASFEINLGVIPGVTDN